MDNKELHDQIMNIPAKRKHLDFDRSEDRVLYMEGHRDARHSAAELALTTTSPAPAVVQMTDEQINRIVRDMAELPDRDSPPDQPEMMLVSADELRTILSASGVK